MARRGEVDLIFFEPVFDGHQDLAQTRRIGAEAAGKERVQNVGVGVALDGVEKLHRGKDLLQMRGPGGHSGTVIEIKTVIALRQTADQFTVFHTRLLRLKLPCRVMDDAMNNISSARKGGKRESVRRAKRKGRLGACLFGKPLDKIEHVTAKDNDDQDKV